MATFAIGSRTRTSTSQKTEGVEIVENVAADDEKKPTEEKDAYWILEQPRDVQNLNTEGKWMMFYPDALIDNAWVKAKRLFRDRSLTG